MLSNVAKVVACVLLFCTFAEASLAILTQDQTTSRANTLYDDADDLQKQLDNEARDRIKFGRPKTIWVFNIPTQLPISKSINIQVDRVKRSWLEDEAESNMQDTKDDLSTDCNNNNAANSTAANNTAADNIAVDNSSATNSAANNNATDSSVDSNSAADNSAVDNSTAENCAADKSATDNSTTDNSACDNSSAEKNMADNSAADNNAANNSATANSAVDNTRANNTANTENSPSAKQSTQVVKQKTTEDAEEQKTTENANEEEDTTTDIAVTMEPEEGWNYLEQHKWAHQYQECGGRSQSPVDLPTAGLVKTIGARPLIFGNYDVMPKTLIVRNEGNMFVLYGEWPPNRRPFIYGGAAHSRRYLFHSLTLHWPSEHSISTFKYPMETQALHVSADYESFEQAINTTSDMQAFLNVANIYKYSDKSQQSLLMILNASMDEKYQEFSREIPLRPLSSFVPVFKEYASYQGSLSFPPCTESVLWLVRGRTLPVTRETAECVNKLINGPGEPQPGQFFIRALQPLNDRKVFLFK